MFKALMGWYWKKFFECTFDTITFTETVDAGETKITSLGDAKDGEIKADRIGNRYFIITSVYSLCTPGMVDVAILPDGDTAAKFYIQVFESIERDLPVPLLLTSDLQLIFTNSEGSANNVYITFDGFWIRKTDEDMFTSISKRLSEPLCVSDIAMLRGEPTEEEIKREKRREREKEREKRREREKEREKRREREKQEIEKEREKEQERAKERSEVCKVEVCTVP